MSNKYKFYNPDGTYFITFAVIYWIDVFTRDDYRNILINSVEYCINKKGLVVHAWVIMTNHVHMIVSRKGNNKLEEILRDMKKHTSVEIIHEIESRPYESRKEWMLSLFEKAGRKNPNNVKFQFWQQDNHPIELTNNFMYDQKLEYIHQNPVVQGFVEKAEDYVWSSMKDYIVGKGGLVKIELIE